MSSCHAIKARVTVTVLCAAGAGYGQAYPKPVRFVTTGIGVSTDLAAIKR